MNNWYVITGAPCSGKTTVLNSLKDLGYEVVPEVARTYIDELIFSGLSIEQIRSNETKFQDDVLIKKYELEESLDKNKIIFLDRGIWCWGSQITNFIILPFFYC
jgi:predicted ATPase